MKNMKFTSMWKKTAHLLSRILLSTAAVTALMWAATFAAAPAGGYLPWATLDPDCAAWDADCVVVFTDPKFVDGTNNDVVLDYPGGKDIVSYTQSGTKVYDKTDVLSDGYSITLKEYTQSGLGDYNEYNLNKAVSSNITVTNTGSNNRVLFQNVGIIDSADTNTWKTITLNANGLTVNRDNTNDYVWLYWESTWVRHYGWGKINAINGTINSWILWPDSEAITVRGEYNQAVTNSNITLPNLIWSYTYTSMRGEGSVDNVYWISNRIITSHEAWGNVKNMYGIFNNITTGATWSGSVNNVFWTRIRTYIQPATTVTNEYGLYIDNVDDGTTNNYSIFTNEWLVYHKDSVWIGITKPLTKLHVAWGDATINTITVWRWPMNNAFSTVLWREAYMEWTWNYNVAVWAQSLIRTTTWASNTAIWGYRTLENNTTWLRHTAVWTYALRNNIDGSSNTAIWYDAMQWTTGWNYNIGVWFRTLGTIWTGSDNNVWIGPSAWRLFSSWSSNLFLWYRAADVFGTWSSNIAIWPLSNLALNEWDNQLVIADAIYWQNINDNNTTKIWIGTKTPSTALEVHGGITYKSQDNKGTVGTRQQSIASYSASVNSSTEYIHIRLPHNVVSQNGWYRVEVEWYDYGWPWKPIDIRYVWYAYVAWSSLTRNTQYDMWWYYSPASYVWSDNHVYLRFKPDSLYNLSFVVNYQAVNPGAFTVNPWDITVIADDALQL